MIHCISTYHHISVTFLANNGEKHQFFLICIVARSIMEQNYVVRGLIIVMLSSVVSGRYRDYRQAPEDSLVECLFDLEFNDAGKSMLKRFS